MQRSHPFRPSPATTLLTPVPREVDASGESLSFAGVRLDAHPVCARAARALGAVPSPAATNGPGAGGRLHITITADGDLPAEGYTLHTAPGVGGPRAVIRGADPVGVFYGAQTLLTLLGERPGQVPLLSVRDWPQLAWRGTVEGFYGAPWSHADRLEHLRFAGRHKLNHFVYAPKDDPFHRDRWREPYPPEELALLAELVETARAQHVRLVYALSPGLSMRYGDPVEHRRLRAKAEQLWSIGVRDFALLFDDIPTELRHPEDLAMFGEAPGTAGAAHGHTCAQFVEHFLAPRAVSEPLLMVPTDYAGTTTSPYRERLAATLPADVLVWWTGQDIIIDEITRQHVEEAAASYGRRLLLWDNFPVNDFDRTRLFLGPLTGRATSLEDTALAGISANPMIEAAPSQLALVTVADYAWNPPAYDAAASAARALRSVAGPDADALAPLVRACSAWPLEAPQDRELQEHVATALDDDGELGRSAARAVHTALAGLANVPERVSGETALVRQLGPWIAAGADMARAGRLAAELLLAHQDGTEHNDLRDRTQAALDDAERHYPNVLREIVPTFVREVLRRAGPADAAAPGTPWAMVVSGPQPAAGEDTFAQSLRGRGLEVRFSETADLGEHDPAHPPVLVVVTRSAAPEAARAAGRLPVPLLAWAHLVDAGLATKSAVALVDDRIDVVAPDDSLAAGRSGRVTVYRGPGKVTWGEPAADATVVARTVGDARPAIVHYAVGATLADGSAAPAPRIATFLGRPALAPWLMTEDGLALVAAAVAELTVTAPVAGTAASRPG